MQRRHCQGFSLVELSIVLVILGLLTGGILAGQSLIRAAELRAVTAEYSRYITAVQSFRDKYFALPGDMTNASAFWGALDGNDGSSWDCRGESTGLPTCNGDGDGRIEEMDAVNANTYEKFLFWKHLANAGFIEGSYSGSASFVASTVCPSNSGGIYDYVAGCNLPLSKMRPNFWNAVWVGSVSSSVYYFDGNYGNILSLSNSVIKQDELWNIDTKIDDGKPGTGNMVGSRPLECANATFADAATAQYWLNPPSWASGYRCIPIFRNIY